MGSPNRVKCPALLSRHTDYDSMPILITLGNVPHVYYMFDIRVIHV